MILIMAGLPKSGKSFVVRQLSDVHQSLVIDPQRLVPPEVSRSAKEYREALLCAWQVAYEKLLKSITSEPPDKIIIFDTCASRSTTISEISAAASITRHRTCLIFIHAEVQVCLVRAGDEVDLQTIRDYEQKFVNSLRESRAYCDNFVVINNTRGKPDLSRLMKLIEHENDRIHKPKSA